MKAAVETTLTAPPPSSLPSRCWSVTWTTRYVTCNVERERKELNIFLIRFTRIPRQAQNLTRFVDLFIISIDSLQPALESDAIILISAVRWSHFRDALKHEHIVWDVICLRFRMCLIQFENKSRKMSLFVPRISICIPPSCDSPPDWHVTAAPCQSQARPESHDRAH